MFNFLLLNIYLLHEWVFIADVLVEFHGEFWMSLSDLEQYIITHILFEKVP